ncbi:40S ribosomal protein S6 [Gracilariopsis chorda]|uniref:40S ribosomal protein S6 n=1 Tax=Gracilariopsis chorda TaxID=448386 RepID=A0A2V3J3U5_9FLOR|nr:40S ribosomal protein S6 [Gracilariopsis chorda]|eukprot:PXF49039.1 40S ribosomal protein S6 [Gracilariopsis chorda]
MKLNLADPQTGAQKQIDVDDEKRLQHLYDMRLAQEVKGDDLGDDYKGYIFRIMGGQDKQGFAMKQGVLTPNRVRLLMNRGTPGCRGYGMRKGERKRKSVRGCIISHEIAVLNLVVVKSGESPIAGLSDRHLPRRLGPKRASKIRKLFNLTKADDVRKYVIRREIPLKEGAREGAKPKSKAPKIQRLVTPLTIHRKRRRFALKIASIKASKAAAAEYEKLLVQRNAQARESRKTSLSKRRSTKADH